MSLFLLSYHYYSLSETKVADCNQQPMQACQNGRTWLAMRTHWQCRPNRQWLLRWYFFVQGQHYDQLWLELVTPSCHPPFPWTRAPCPVLCVQKDCNCNHESHVLICFKALRVISGFTPAWEFHSEVCGYGTQIPTRFGSYKIDLLTSSASGIFGVKFIFYLIHLYED
jgi:hypothetical protein